MKESLITSTIVATLIASAPCFAEPSSQAMKVSKVLESTKQVQAVQQQKDEIAKAGQPATVLPPAIQVPQIPALKSLEQVAELKRIKETQETIKNASRFRTLNPITIKLENGSSLTLGIMAEMDTEIPGFISLLSEFEPMILREIEMELSSLSAEPLASEKESRVILKRVLGKVNSESKSPFIVDLNYIKFELS